ncbi:hypothetical protein ACS0PU_011459 [Formica fusca]
MRSNRRIHCKRKESIVLKLSKVSASSRDCGENNGISRKKYLYRCFLIRSPLKRRFHYSRFARKDSHNGSHLKGTLTQEETFPEFAYERSILPKLANCHEAIFIHLTIKISGVII